jgi:hypothetical protein
LRKEFIDFKISYHILVWHISNTFLGKGGGS